VLGSVARTRRPGTAVGRWGQRLSSRLCPWLKGGNSKPLVASFAEQNWSRILAVILTPARSVCLSYLPRLGVLQILPAQGRQEPKRCVGLLPYCLRTPLLQ
jgi:hypothetical protein